MYIRPEALEQFVRNLQGAAELLGADDKKKYQGVQGARVLMDDLRKASGFPPKLFATYAREAERRGLLRLSVTERNALRGDEYKDNPELSSEERHELSSRKFAIPSLRKLPIHDASHTRNAMARFNQTKATQKQLHEAFLNIVRAAQRFGIDSDHFEEEYGPRYGVVTNPDDAPRVVVSHTKRPEQVVEVEGFLFDLSDPEDAEALEELRPDLFDRSKR